MITAQSLVTLNLRISHPETGEAFISTFESTPATLQLGAGELSAGIESSLIGLKTGTHTTLELPAGQAFGHYNPELIERVKRSDIPTDFAVEKDAVLRFAAPDGSSYPGLVTELTDTEAVIDFNHPLAGRKVTLEVQIIGVINP